MNGQRHHVAGVVGFVAALAAIYVIQRPALTGAERWAAILASTVVAGIGLGYAQSVADRRSDHEKRPVFESRVANTAWWALFCVVSLSTVLVVSAGSNALTSVVPTWPVVAAFVLLCAVTFWLGGVDPAFSPSNWRRQYREGKAEAGDGPAN